MHLDIYRGRRRESVIPAARVEEELDAVAFARARLRFDPDEKQATVLRSGANRGILNCSRQWGKSTVAAAKAVHRAYTTAGALVVVASPTHRQSAEFVRKAAALVRNLGIRPRRDGDNEISILFPNGARIVGLPGMEGNVRGFSAASLMVIDEAAYMRTEMYRTLRPMLAVGGGDLWLMSTPAGKYGFFYETWEHGAGWERFSVKATECPRISKEFLEQERRELGAQAFEREYMCAFTDSGDQLFEREMLERAFDGSVKPLFFRSPWGDR